jgi:hypothetical protein
MLRQARHCHSLYNAGGGDGNLLVPGLIGKKKKIIPIRAI